MDFRCHIQSQDCGRLSLQRYHTLSTGKKLSAFRRVVTFYLFTAWSRVLLEKPTGPQLIKKFLAFYGKKVHYRIYKCLKPVPIFSQTNPVHAPHPTSWISILILSFNWSLSLPSCHFPLDFPIKNLYTLLLASINATCPVHLILLGFITRKILDEVYRPLSSSLFSFHYSFVTSSFLGPNILFNTLFSNTLSLCFSNYVNVQV